jgi:hypothetical protein
MVSFVHVTERTVLYIIYHLTSRARAFVILNSRGSNETSPVYKRAKTNLKVRREHDTCSSTTWKIDCIVAIKDPTRRMKLQNSEKFSRGTTTVLQTEQLSANYIYHWYKKRLRRLLSRSWDKLSWTRLTLTPPLLILSLAWYQIWQWSVSIGFLKEWICTFWNNIFFCSK